MNLVISRTRLLKTKNFYLNVRCLNEDRPVLRRPRSYSLVGNEYQEEEKKNEGIDAIGWLLFCMPITTFLLGTWQVQRKKWKTQLLQDLKSKIKSSPKPLPDNLEKLEEMEYQPVKVRGEFLYDKEFKMGPKTLIKDGVAVGENTGGLISTKSNTGYWIITPFKLQDRDLTILINRGWVKARREQIPENELGHVPGTIEITGIVRLHEKRPVFMPKNSPNTGLYVYRDLKSMARNTDSAPVFLDLIASDGTPGGPIAGQTRIVLRNEHLSYIVTWYTLSFLTGLMWHRMYIKKLPLL